MKKVLITNDDGYKNRGIRELVEAVKDIPNTEFYVVAPRYNQSSTGRGYTRKRRLTLREEDPIHGVPTYSVNGSPATCVVVGMEKVIGETPDLILSGINKGANLGRDSFTASGTIGAAIEGSLYGIPSIASCMVVPKSWRESEKRYEIDYGTAKFYSKLLAEYILDDCDYHYIMADVLNVGFPPFKMAGFMITKPSKSRFRAPYLEDGDNGFQVKIGMSDAEGEDVGTDVWASFLAENVSITPVSFFDVNYKELNLEQYLKDNVTVQQL